jgi:hypothetical protein
MLSAFALATDKFPMRNSSIDPAATAVVHADTDRNGNVQLVLDAKHLAPPDRLTPAHSVYVVWIQAPGKSPEELGVLRVNTDDMAASFKGETPYKSFDIFVTAEDNPKPEAPSGTEVLRGTVQK